MKIPPVPVIKRPTAIIGWLTIVTQAALPLSLAYSPLVKAAQTPEASALKWYQSADQQSQQPFADSADTLADIGSALSQDNSTNAVSGMARSAATGALNNSVEQWLSQFGTARVQLNVDEKFRANGSEADLLVPLYEREELLLFTQLGFRHKDSRNTGNLGVGARYFAGDWMLGLNTFLDNDFSGKNRRMGVGVEAWRDYLKLSANSYLRLTDWHQSRDFSDYDERPANGYDLRAEGWLPAFPQLGAKVMFEKYQGNEVALFGKDNRQQNPWAFTGGINYTPVPLVTVGAQHRAGKDGNSDSQLSLELNYRLGEPWNKQIDPNLVGASRTLNGTRYDLVERNNSIVLDYRKQDTVTLVLPEKSSGKGHDTLPIIFSVKTKSPLQRIDWDAATLVAAGGTITQVGNDRLNVVLPAYQAGRDNLYHFAGVAYDVNGNSGSATAQIQVEVGDVSANTTKVSATPTTLLADGKSTSTLKVELFDDASNPVGGMTKSLSASLDETAFAGKSMGINSAEAPIPAKLSAFEEVSPGIYQATLTASNRAGSVLITPRFNDVALPGITIEQNADDASGHIDAGALLAVVDNSVADNKTENQVGITITDAVGNPLSNMGVNFSLSGAATVAPGSSLNVTTDNQGQAKIGVTDKTAEEVTVTAKLANGNSATVVIHFMPDSATADMQKDGVTVDKQMLIANNADKATYSAVVKDANGNGVPNFTVNWGTNLGTLSGSTSNTNADGVATVTLTSTSEGSAQVTAQAGKSGSINAPMVQFNADTGSAAIGSDGLKVDKTTLLANDIEMATYTATVKDANGNVVPNLNVEWKTNLGELSAATSATNSQGVATITLKGKVAGEAQVTAAVNGGAAINADKVTFTADPSSAVIGSGDLSVTPTTITANGTDKATFTAIVKDANGNPVPDADVTWTTDAGTLSATSGKSDANGASTVTLTGTKTGTAQVSATVNGKVVNATPVTLIADVATAKIESLTSDLPAIVGTGSQSTLVTLVLKDANGNVVADQEVNWGTTLSSVSNASSKTNSQGVATTTLQAIQYTEKRNGTATVTATTAHDSKTTDVTITTVMSVGGTFYWTMNVAHPTSDKSTAAGFCSTNGGGRLFVESDVATFVNNGGDFRSKSVSGEYNNDWYRLADNWDTRRVDLYGNGSSLGNIEDGEGEHYICVK